MSTWAQMQAALPGRPRWQLIGFAAGCAERLAPMAASLGGSTVGEAAQTGLDVAWNAASSGAAPPGTEQLIEQLMITMEETAEGPRPLGQLAAHALNLTVFALEVAVSSTPTDRAQAAGAGGVDLLRQVDFVLTHDPLDTMVTIESDEDPEEPPGPLETEELRAQEMSIDLLGVGDRPDARALETIRQRSKAQAAELARVLPEFERRWG